MTEVLMLTQTVVFVVTLLVLVLQTRNLQKTVYASNYGRMIEMLKDLRFMRIQDPTLARVYQGEVEGLSDEEIRHHFFNLTVLSIFEMLFVDRKQGLITEDTWQFWLDAIRRLGGEQSFRSMVLRDSHKIVNPEFAKIVEGIIQDVVRSEATENPIGAAENL